MKKIVEKYGLWITLTTHYLLFFCAWLIFEVIFKQPLKQSLNNEVLGEVARELVKLIIWVLPSAYLIKKYEPVLPCSLKNMFCSKVHWPGAFQFLALLVVLYAVSTLRTFAAKGNFGISENFKSSDIVWFLTVGLTEELVFRGWIQNALLTKLKSSNAVVYTNILFALIHIPIYMQKGIFDLAHAFDFFSIFGLGLIFSYAFIKSKNILVPIFLHTLWDVLVTVFACK